jgi:hypothetical protein
MGFIKLNLYTKYLFSTIWLHLIDEFPESEYSKSCAMSIISVKLRKIRNLRKRDKYFQTVTRFYKYWFKFFINKIILKSIWLPQY